MRFLFATPASLVGPILRLGLAVVIWPHGAQKVLGWYGGSGFEAQMETFTEGFGLPWAVAFLVIVAEFLGPVALVLGLCTRLAALGIGAVMVGAVVQVHLRYGFFMNWYGQQEGEGYEYHILAVAIALGLLVHGAGRFSLDRRIARPAVDRLK